MITVAEIKKITRGTLVQGETSMNLSGVSIDSRAIRQRNVFIAIKGERFNGHDFIRTALRKGATAVLVSQRIACSEDVAVIRVKNTTEALGQIAAWHRQQFNIPVIAITGSAGKTTTKDLIASVLSTRYKVLKNNKTENNQFGVPLTLLRLNSSHQIAVLELGTNQSGDIRRLAQIVRPTSVVLTNIGEAHLSGLKSPQGVFREKIQLIKYMKPRGTIILNGDDRFLNKVTKKKYQQEVITFGIRDDVDIKAGHISLRNNRKLQFQVRRSTFMINSPAAHNVYNALAAISCGLRYKIRYNEMSDRLGRFRFSRARQQIIKQGSCWIIDDTYNANPVSLNSAINTLNTLAVNGKRIVVCADMLELGSRSENLHRSAGKRIAGSAANVVITVGTQARYITESIRRSNDHIKVRHCSNLNEVHRRLKSLYSPGDAVLIKGSRGMRMERTVAFCKSHLK